MNIAIEVDLFVLLDFSNNSFMITLLNFESKFGVFTFKAGIDKF